MGVALDSARGVLLVAEAEELREAFDRRRPHRRGAERDRDEDRRGEPEQAPARAVAGARPRAAIAASREPAADHARHGA